MRGSDAPTSPLGISAFLLRGWMGWAEALPPLRSLPPHVSPGSNTIPLSLAPPPREVVVAVAELLLSYLGGNA